MAKKFPNNLLKIRTQLDLKQVDVASMMGITPPEYSRFEKQERRMDADKLKAAARALNVSVNDIICDDEQALYSSAFGDVSEVPDIALLVAYFAEMEEFDQEKLLADAKYYFERAKRKSSGLPRATHPAPGSIQEGRRPLGKR